MRFSSQFMQFRVRHGPHKTLTNDSKIISNQIISLQLAMIPCSSLHLNNTQ